MFDIENELNALKIKVVEPDERMVYETKMRIRNMVNKKQPARKIKKIPWKKYLFSHLAVKVPVAAALLMAIALLPFLTVPVGGVQYVQAFYTIDINPSVELKVDTADNVVSVECRNSDAVALMRNVNCIGAGISEAIKMIVAEARSLHYIAKDKENYVLVARFGPEGGSIRQNDLAKMVSDAAGTEAKVLYLIGSLTDKQEAEEKGKLAGVLLLEKEARSKGIDPGKYQQGKGGIGGIMKEIEEKEYPAPSVSGRISGSRVVLSWNRIDAPGFRGYKVVASRDNPSPKYPEDGYIGHITNPDVTSYTVKHNVKAGESYYFSVTALYEGDVCVAGNAVRLTVPEEKSRRRLPARSRRNTPPPP